jgi:hypothetical protein
MKLWFFVINTVTQYFNSQIRTLYMGLDRTEFSEFCVHLLLFQYIDDILNYSIPFIIILLITFLLYQPMQNIW